MRKEGKQKQKRTEGKPSSKRDRKKEFSLRIEVSLLGRVLQDPPKKETTATPDSRAQHRQGELCMSFPI